MDNRISVTKEEFIKTSSQVLAESQLNKLIEKQPTLLLAFALYSAELADKLFSLNNPS